MLFMMMLLQEQLFIYTWLKCSNHFPHVIISLQPVIMLS